MTQEQDEFLNECDLDEHECESKNKEVSTHAYARAVRPDAFAPQQWQQNQHGTGQQSLDECCDQDQVSPFDQSRTAAFP